MGVRFSRPLVIISLAQRNPHFLLHADPILALSAPGRVQKFSHMGGEDGPRSKATLKRYVALAGRINSHLISFSHVSDARLCSSRPRQFPPDPKEKHT
ncbi:hypothetical protein NQZ68_002614 [Dissostichus eleginoides]|nr:hypothetical protein NQZ68_002614 [Dissostichus eleginoides]